MGCGLGVGLGLADLITDRSDWKIKIVTVKSYNLTSEIVLQLPLKYKLGMFENSQIL